MASPWQPYRSAAAAMRKAKSKTARLKRDKHVGRKARVRKVNVPKGWG